MQGRTAPGVQLPGIAMLLSAECRVPPPPRVPVSPSPGPRRDAFWILRLSLLQLCPRTCALPEHTAPFPVSEPHVNVLL